ncbi:hypothetical protein F5X99DRAFT_312934 [Biscogniauxia marginata]|nr:hypothetical protein F5X99DRAFT_312934 [Biscogniauxia marginata]
MVKIGPPTLSQQVAKAKAQAKAAGRRNSDSDSGDSVYFDANESIGDAVPKGNKKKQKAKVKGGGVQNFHDPGLVRLVLEKLDEIKEHAKKEVKDELKAELKKEIMREIPREITVLDTIKQELKELVLLEIKDEDELKDHIAERIWADLQARLASETQNVAMKELSATQTDPNTAGPHGPSPEMLLASVEQIYANLRQLLGESLGQNIQALQTQNLEAQARLAEASRALTTHAQASQPQDTQQAPVSREQQQQPQPQPAMSATEREAANASFAAAARAAGLAHGCRVHVLDSPTVLRVAAEHPIVQQVEEMVKAQGLFDGIDTFPTPGSSAPEQPGEETPTAADKGKGKEVAVGPETASASASGVASGAASDTATAPVAASSSAATGGDGGAGKGKGKGPRRGKKGRSSKHR